MDSPFAATVPAPEKTPQTPPASYGPEYGPSTSGVGTTSIASGSSSARSESDVVTVVAEQLADRRLGLEVAALAVVVVVEHPVVSNR